MLLSPRIHKHRLFITTILLVPGGEGPLYTDFIAMHEYNIACKYFYHYVTQHERFRKRDKTFA